MSYVIGESNFIILANNTMNSIKKSLHVQKFSFINIVRGKWQDVRTQQISKMDDAARPRAFWPHPHPDVSLAHSVFS